MATAQERKKSKKSAEPEEPVPAPPVQVEEEKTVDRIRDIIFGPQMRDYEERFQALERQLRRPSGRSASIIASATSFVIRS